MSFAGVFAKIIAKAKQVETIVLSDIEKAAADADGVVSKLSADAPELAAVVNAAVPGAGSIVTIAVGVAEKLCDALDAGGAAAEQNLKNAGLDETAIADLKGLAASVKKAV